MRDDADDFAKVPAKNPLKLMYCANILKFVVGAFLHVFFCAVARPLMEGFWTYILPEFSVPEFILARMSGARARDREWEEATKNELKKKHISTNRNKNNKWTVLESSWS